MRRIELAGTHAAMGEAFGEAFRDDVARLYAIRVENALRQATPYGGRATSEADLSATALAARAQAALEGVAAFDARLAAVIDTLAGAQAQLEDAAHSLASYLHRTEPEPERLAELDSRISAWLSLARRLRRPPAGLPALLQSRGYALITASLASFAHPPLMSAYAASKAGVVGLTKSLAVELGRHGVTVNCICPGPIHTGMTSSITDEAKELYAKRRVPLRRYGVPEEVAQMTLNLCLPASSFVNGAVIPVDGGMTIRHT